MIRIVEKVRRSVDEGTCERMSRVTMLANPVLFITYRFRFDICHPVISTGSRQPAAGRKETRCSV